MSFLYRPTPVVILGNGAFASTRVLGGRTGGCSGATMRGIPAGASRLGGPSPTGAASRMRRVNTSFQPWIKTSGTMGSFIPNGLGQDDGFDSSFDFSGNIAPTLPDVYPTSDFPAPDLGLPGFSPNVSAVIPVGAGPLPPLNLQPSIYSAPTTLTPPAGAGPTGTGIPGTQPLNLVAPAISAGTGLLNTIKSFFTPKPAVATNYKQLPGYGGGAATPVQAQILPGVSNTILLFGVGAVVLIAVMGGGKK